MEFLLQKVFNYLSFWSYKEEQLFHKEKNSSILGADLDVHCQQYFDFFIDIDFILKVQRFLNNKLTNAKTGGSQKASNKQQLNININNLL